MPKIFDLLLNDFRLSKRNFNRILSVGLLFVLFGYFYIVEPYFRYKLQEKNSVLELERKQSCLEELSKSHDRLKETSSRVDSALRSIKSDIQGFPDHLRAMLPKIEGIVSSSASSQANQEEQPRSIDNIHFPSRLTSFKDGVRWYTKKWFGNVVIDLEEDIIKPALLLKEKETALGDKLDSLSKNAIEKIHRYIEDVDPNFWRSYREGKVPVAQGLINILEVSFTPIYEEIKSLKNEIDISMEKQKEVISNTKNEVKDLKTSLGNLESRIKSIESPIGKIPLNLTDFTEVFPLLIVILIVLLTVYLNKSKRLYTALRIEITKDGIDKEIPDIQYLASGWYLPPYRNIVQPLSLGISIIIIIGIYIRSVLHSIASPEFFISIIGEEEVIRKLVFICFYLIGVLVITGCLWFSQRSLRLKGKKTEGETSII